MSTISPSSIIALGAMNGALAVILGAFGAHALRSKISQDLLRTYQTAVEYHMYHALALILVGILMYQQQKVGNMSQLAGQGVSSLGISGYMFLVGILLFCGSLYGLALGGPRWFGPVTPLGGLCFIIAWGLLVYSSLTSM